LNIALKLFENAVLGEIVQNVTRLVKTSFKIVVRAGFLSSLNWFLQKSAQKLFF
jgi:hypothetical protein